MLLHQLRGDGNDGRISPVRHLALEDSARSEENTSADVSPTTLMKTSLTFKHCNSFNSEMFDGSLTNSPSDSTGEKVISMIEKRLSADSEVFGKETTSVRRKIRRR